MILELDLSGEVWTREKDFNAQSPQKKKQVAVISGLEVVLYGEISQGDSLSALRKSVLAGVRQKAQMSNKAYAFAFACSNNGDLAIEFLEITPNGHTVVQDHALEYGNEAEIKKAFEWCYKRA